MLSSFKSFAIAFVIAVLIFGVAAYYTYPLLENSILGGFDAENEADTSVSTGEAVGSDTATVEVTPPEQDDKLDGKSFTVLFVIHDKQSDLFNDYRADIESSSSATIEQLAQASRHYKADTLVIMRASADTRTYMFTALPNDTYVTVGGAELTLGSVYEAYGTDILKSVVQAVTSLTIDNYVLFDFNTFKAAIDVLGGVSFNVPQNMDDVYEDESVNGAMYTINLKKGTQKLNGDAALQLLRYDKYDTGSKGRASVAAKFMKSIADQYFNASSFQSVKNAFSTIKNSPSAKTDISTKSLDEARTMIEAYSLCKQKTEEFKGSYQTINENRVFIYNQKEVYSAYMPYKD